MKSGDGKQRTGLDGRHCNEPGPALSVSTRIKFVRRVTPQGVCVARVANVIGIFVEGESTPKIGILMLTMKGCNT